MAEAITPARKRRRLVKRETDGNPPHERVTNEIVDLLNTKGLLEDPASAMAVLLTASRTVARIWHDRQMLEAVMDTMGK